MKIKFEQTTFGELKSGDWFSLSALIRTIPQGLPTMGNVKLAKEGIAAKESERMGPFNVVSFDGRFRTFRDDEKVYKLTLEK